VEEGTLNGYLEDVKAQFLDATTHHPVEPTQLIGGIPVAGLRDWLPPSSKSWVTAESCATTSTS